MKAHLIGIFGDKLERGEGLHLDGLQLVLCGVDLCDHHILVLSKVVPQIIPDWGQLLAMSAPRSIWRDTMHTITAILHLNFSLKSEKIQLVADLKN